MNADAMEMDLMRGPCRGARRHRRASLAAPAIWALLLAAAIVAVGSLPSSLDRTPPGAASAIASSVRVRPRDTLWSIAEATRVPGRTVAQTVEDIRSLNGMQTARVTAGTLLRVPASDAPDDAYAQATNGDPIR